MPTSDNKSKLVYYTLYNSRERRVAVACGAAFGSPSHNVCTTCTMGLRRDGLPGPSVQRTYSVTPSPFDPDPSNPA